MEIQTDPRPEDLEKKSESHEYFAPPTPDEKVERADADIQMDGEDASQDLEFEAKSQEVEAALRSREKTPDVDQQ